ncbi:MAG: phosphatidylglycerophosphatase [Gammaproteobacteria bacterium]|jgi:phosphatidylglycerophosphatase C|nr:phosphatidylglycerophosphatase [Gammaproteobacteria bacterium]
MTAPHAASIGPCVAIFDLDGTLTWRDTLLPFLTGYALRHPVRLLALWRLPLAIAAYLAHRDRGLLKSRVIRAIMGGDLRSTIEAWAESFVAGLKRRRVFRPAALAAVEAHRAAGDRLVLLSASPDLYVPGIGRLLGFDLTLCTEVQWRHIASEEDRLDGALRTPNRRDEEKSRCLAWLRAQYPNLPVIAYGNSRSDIPHLREADRALLVNGSPAARRAATATGIPVADWT